MAELDGGMFRKSGEEELPRDEPSQDHEARLELEPESPPGEVEDQGGGEHGQRRDSKLYKKIMAFNDFIDQTAPGLTPGEFQVWCVLFRFENQGVARATLETIGQRLGKKRKQVSRDIKGLIKKQALKREARGNSWGRSNEYRLGIVLLPPIQRDKAKPEKKVATKPRKKPR